MRGACPAGCEKPLAMTRDEAIAKLKAAQNDWDTECAHGDADGVLCALLKSLGYGDVVDEWEKIKKWYA